MKKKKMQNAQVDTFNPLQQIFPLSNIKSLDNLLKCLLIIIFSKISTYAENLYKFYTVDCDKRGFIADEITKLGKVNVVSTQV